MVKQLLTFTLFTVSVFGLTARTLTSDEALARLQTSGMAKAAAKGALSHELVATEVTSLGEPSVYLFNEGRSGYLILSADDAAIPVLGYSDRGSLDADNLPPQLKWWLGEYTRQIEYARANGVEGISTKPLKIAGEGPVAPMLKSTWDQGEPYNNECPMSAGIRTYTGCVATAMAQVMNYWKYPAVGKGRVSYDDDNLGKRLSLNFASRAFDWENMLDHYIPGQYNDAQAAAVAYLMKACGYGAKMQYGTDSSGALAMNTAPALVNNFDYDPNLVYELRDYFSASEWTRKMIENLRNVGPVLYGGASMIGGGHSFVCDGYDGEGYFHFNWGWSNMSDGYYALDALNPSALGAGGGGGGGYNFTQDAVFGIQPPTGKPVEARPVQLTQTGTLEGEITDGKLMFSLGGSANAMWANYTSATYNAQFGAFVEPQGATPGSKAVYPVYDKSLKLIAGYGTDPAALKASLDLASLNLADGTYKITVASRKANEEDAAYQPLRPYYGCYNYLTLTKKGEEYELVVPEIAEVKIKSARWTTGLYFGTLAKVEVTVTNETDQEMSRGFAPVLVDASGTPAFLGESALITVKPGETVTREWLTELVAMQQNLNVTQDTEFYFAFVNEETLYFYQDFMTAVTMHATPPAPVFSRVGEPEITNAKPNFITVGNSMIIAYEIEEPTNIQAEASFTLKSGIFAYPAYLTVLVPNDENTAYVIVDNQGDVIVTDKPGTHKLAGTFSIPTMQAGKIYEMTLTYGVGNSLMPMDQKSRTYLVLKTNAVDDITAEGSELQYVDGAVLCDGQAIEVYSLEGQLRAAGRDAVSTEALSAGVYVARAGGRSLKILVR